VLRQQSALRSVHPLSNEGKEKGKEEYLYTLYIQCISQRATVEKRKSSVKHKSAGGIAMPPGRANYHAASKDVFL